MNKCIIRGHSECFTYSKYIFKVHRQESASDPVLSALSPSICLQSAFFHKLKAKWPLSLENQLSNK